MAEDVIPEIQAITTLLKVLGPLKPEERENVIDFVFRKLGIKRASQSSPQSQSTVDDFFRVEGRTDEAKPEVVHSISDIRSLRQDKQPKTATEMVALVAYYLEHIAPEEERRNYITPDDISRYFKQGDFKLPSAPPSVTLANAKNAGYLNAPTKRGQYRLSPVGYNLVVHKLPTERTPQKRSTRKKAE